MDIKNYIQAGLDAGKSMEDIMNGIADAANEMLAEQAKVQENQEKYDRAQEILDLIYAFCKEYYPDLVTEDADFSGEELCEIMDDLAPILKATIELGKATSNLNQKEVRKITIPMDNVKDPDAAIAKFLRDLGI